MILTIDVGNTNVVWDVWNGEKWIKNWRSITLKTESPLLYYQQEFDQYMIESGLFTRDIKYIVYSSVVPNLRDCFRQVLKRFKVAKLLYLGTELYPKIDFKVPKPDEIGQDLVSNAYAANKIYKSDIIVVDFGTALTFTTVAKHGEILGVAIAPGIKTAIQALSSKADQLPIVPLDVPTSAIGKDTVHAIQSGILFGYIGLVKEVIKTIQSEVGDTYATVATGGLSKVLMPLQSVFDHYNFNLTLEGLRMIAEKIYGNK